MRNYRMSKDIRRRDIYKSIKNLPTFKPVRLVNEGLDVAAHLANAFFASSFGND